MLMEKHTRKRQTAKTDIHKQRLSQLEKMKGVQKVLCEQSQLKIREKKMLWYCDYFMSLFDLKMMNPFYQMVKHAEVDHIR